MAAQNPDFAASHKKVMATIKREVGALTRRKASGRTSKDRKAQLARAIATLRSVQSSVGGICQSGGGDMSMAKRKTAGSSRTRTR